MDLDRIALDFPEAVDEIRREESSFSAKRAELERDDCDLTIAIVGQVKSGKSSFLNALLFDGEGVLPQAATPMTAALTFIRYDVSCHAEVEFFTEKQWKGFELQAARLEGLISETRKKLEEREIKNERNARREYRDYKRREITEKLVLDELGDRAGQEDLAARELVRMAQGANADDLMSRLGRVERIEDVESPVELIGRLRDYVGAAGRFTPIVCSTTLYLNDPHLKGYRIIDTPGTNDPVVSRGKKTTDNLKKADVVVFLSRAGHFFDESDKCLCAQNLPGSGIRDFILVASQYDAEIRGEADKLPQDMPPGRRLVETVRKVRSDILRNYRVRVRELADQASSNKADDREKWDMLLSKTPYFVSAKAYVLGRHFDRLSAKEQEDLAIFNQMVRGLDFDASTLDRISLMSQDPDRLAPIRQELKKVWDEKEVRLQARRAELADAWEMRLHELVVRLRDHVARQVELLENRDIDELSREREELTRVIEDGRTRFNSAFDTSLGEMNGRFQAVLAEIRELKSVYSKVAVKSESTREAHVEYVSRDGFFGAIADMLLGRQAVTRYTTVRTRYASVYCAVEQVDTFAQRARETLLREMNRASGPECMRRLSNRLVDAVFAFQESGCSGDLMEPDALKALIRRCVDGIRLPEVSLGDDNHAELITSCFSGDRVEDDDVSQLKESQREAIASVFSDLEARANETVAQIAAAFADARDRFVDNLIGTLQSDSKRIADEMATKTETLARWREDLDILGSAPV